MVISMYRYVFIVISVMILSSCSILSNFHQPIESFSHIVKSEIVKRDTLKGSVDDVSKRPLKSTRVSTVHIHDVNVADFIRVAFNDVFKRPYILDKSVELMNRRVDVEISKDVDIYTAIIEYLERLGVLVDDVGGILLFTTLNNNDYQVQSVKATVPVKNNNDIGAIANYMWVYTPIYSRAVDLQKSIESLFEGRELRQSRVIVDLTANKLILKTTASERRDIAKLLAMLDLQRKQVAVDVTVAEISLTDDLSMGLEGFIGGNDIRLQTGVVPNNGYGLTSSLIFGDWIRLILQMGEKHGLIRIRSNPYLLIADGSKSSIDIGSEYPVLSSKKTTISSDTGILSTIEYRKTGIILNLLPVVSGRDVHLSVMVELSEGQKNAVSNIDSPAILQRRIQSDVIVRSGQALILGGLISDSQTNDDRNFLGLIPVGKSRIGNRTELVVILNVSVLNDNNSKDWFEGMADKFEHHDIEVQ